MSIVDRYARPQITALSEGVLKQVRSAGAVLAQNGVKQSEALGQPTPAQRYAKPAPNAVFKSQQVHGERSHALTPDSNLGQKPQDRGRSL